MDKSHVQERHFSRHQVSMADLRFRASRKSIKGWRLLPAPGVVRSVASNS